MRKGRQEFVHILGRLATFTPLLFNPRSKIQNQQSHWLAFIHKETDVALRLSQRQSTFQRHKSRRDVALRLVSECLQNQDFDYASYPPACFRRLQEALQQSHYLVN